jgi:hypothetical protein
LPLNSLAEVDNVSWSTPAGATEQGHDAPQETARRRLGHSVVSGRFDDVFAVVALLAAVTALWAVGQGAVGVALLAAGTISVVVVLRRRTRSVVATLAAARAEIARRRTPTGRSSAPSRTCS